MQIFRGRKSRTTSNGPNSMTVTDRHSAETDQTSTPPHEQLSKSQIKRATRTRKTFALLTSFFLAISVVFLIVVEIGNTNGSKIRGSIYFLKLDLSNIVPATTPNSILINTIAQTLGLHDFYQIGLWNFCEGFKAEGITYCSKPETLYWFDPVETLQQELLAGATIALPAQINTILNLLKLASQWMFALFLTGAVLSFVMILVAPMAIYSRWATVPVALFTLLAALCTTVATVVATALFIIFRNAISSFDELNIGASIGVTMFALMWVAAAFSIFAALLQIGLCCCCASRRDVKHGRKRGSRKAYSNSAYSTEKPQRKGLVGTNKS
ncbi:hypothetical protein EJ08DRAFT_687171 [Tothia fuscella]|uniref:Integral membrane protein n=1 Tax=Tothia fuscella TaxID=1048955 RepID=A0A9P4NUH0_9PEZI|nr:hypothetical protein EJ08DRAFT_687171 [Tothia fuscella]